MKVLKTDVVIVGAGASGCIAAIGAREKGANVTVLEKAVVVRSGSAGGGEKDIACHLKEGEPWDTDDAAREWLTSGGTGNYPFIESEVADVNVRRIGEIVKRLEEYGLEYRRDENGRYFRSQAIGTPGKYLLWFKNGHEFKRRIERQMRLSGAKVLERVFVSQLILVDSSRTGKKRVAGVLGFHLIDGDAYLILANATILATGEAIRLFSNNESSNMWSTWHSPYNNGTAQAIAFESGAEITGLEFTRTTLHPYGMGATGSAVFFGFGGHLLNSRGERYMMRHHPLAERAPRDTLVFATQKEFEEKRGPCFVDLRHLPKDKIETMIELQTKEFLGYSFYYRQMGIDLTRDLLPIEVGSLFAAGGILIDGECRTNVEGLFAAGDCTHARAGLPMALTTGIEAGERAAEYSKTVNSAVDPSEAEKSFEGVTRKTFGPLNSGHGLSSMEFVNRLNKIMNSFVGWHRTESSLASALSELDLLESEAPKLSARNLHDLMRVHEAQHLMVVAKLVTRGALERRESRGWHQRDDFPAEDNNLRGHVILRREVDSDDSRTSISNTFRAI
ncbi:MAG: FAD-binding protein [Nitrososphaerota archaeon]|nr:FAD-binding protein [Nitrososphaerota archaeon]